MDSDDESESRCFEALCELYESGCSHEEAASFLHAITPEHLDALENLASARGFGDLDSLQAHCLDRARAKVKLHFAKRIDPSSPESPDSRTLLSVLAILDEAASASSGEQAPSLNLERALEILGADWKEPEE